MCHTAPSQPGIREDRLLFEAGQWWQERRVVADGPWRLVPRTPRAADSGMGEGIGRVKTGDPWDGWGC
jgi:hypothetical protein